MSDTQPNLRLKITHIDPLEFDQEVLPAIKGTKDFGLYKIVKRTAKSYKLPESNDPIVFLRLEAGDTLEDISSAEFIEIKTAVPGGIITLTQ